VKREEVPVLRLGAAGLKKKVVQCFCLRDKEGGTKVDGGARRRGLGKAHGEGGTSIHRNR